MPRARRRPEVVLVHGLARGPASMRSMAEALSAAGFEPRPYGYASTKATITQLADQLAKDVRANHRRRPVYAVTHSLGGILLRCAPREGITWKRIVMLAPPNLGSTVAASLRGVAFSALFGKAAMQLGAATEDPKAWPFPPAPFAVIAGTRRRSLANPTSWISHRIFDPDTEHDGTVSVDETKLEGMSAFETVDASHTTIMHDTRVHELTISFLRDGWFTRPEEDEVTRPPGDAPSDGPRAESGEVAQQPGGASPARRVTGRVRRPSP